jgi:hypothetical protein
LEKCVHIIRGIIPFDNKPIFTKPSTLHTLLQFTSAWTFFTSSAFLQSVQVNATNVTFETHNTLHIINPYPTNVENRAINQQIADGI